MAGKGRPGPAKGHGGRPRDKTPKARKDGYKRTTVGPKGKGTQEYVQRVVAYGGTIAGGKKAPKGSKAKGTVIDHRSGVRSNNKRSNLRKVSKAQNNANKHRARYPR